LKTEASLNLDIVKFLIVSTNEVDDSKASLPSDLVSKMPVIRKNLKKFSKNIVLSFSTIVESINEQKEAIEQLWETSQGLKDSKLELKSADAEERKKAVHHMSNRKRATLSQLFKNQMASGLSWSKGINFFREFDINRVFSETCPLRLDDSYIEVSCNELFFGNLALFSQLQIAIATPSKELTSIMLDRIKGISGHAMQLTVSHRQELSRVVSLVREFQKSFDNLFKKRLSSDRSTQHVRLFVVVEKAHFILSNFDETYESVLGPLSSDSFSLSDAKDALSIARNVLSSQSLDEQSLLEVNKSLMEVFPEKSAIYEELSRIMDSFEKEDHDEQQENYLIQKSLYNNLITRSMKSVEKLLKSSNEVKEESGSHSRFLDVLSLQSIICSQDQDIKHLLDNLRSFKDPHDQSLSIIEPFVMQYLNLLKYFVTIFTAAQRTFGQKLQILLDLFVHLSQKGFSIPPDVLQEEKDGGTKDLTGTGLDDGEGEAAEDISSRIDNEDQLEDTMRDGEEKNNHENNVDQEEKGIDMDGDFEGRNYDMENDDKEGGDDKKSDGEDEMGDNDRDEGTSYDKKLWEFEDDQGDEEEEMDESGEDGKGEETGEDKIVAAEGVKGEKDDNDQGEEKKTQESNEINENEMDDEYEGEREDTTKTDDKQQKGNETNDFDLPEELDLHEDMPSDGEESGDNGSVMSEDINKELSEGGNITDDEMKDDESMEMDNEGEKSSKEVDPMEKAEEEHSNEDETMKDVLNSLDDVKAPEAIPTEYDDKNQENSATNKEQQKNLSNENERSTDSKESEGVGEAQLDEDEDGHHTTQAAKSSASQEGRKQQKNPSTAKQSNDTRSLGTENDSHTKKQKILPVTSEAEQDTQSESLKESSDYQHVADNNIADENIIDSAARDEAKNVRNLKEEDETKEEHGVEDSDDDAPMEESLKESIKLDQDLPKKSKSEKDKPNSKEELTTNEMMVEGEAIQTSFVERGPASMFATNPEYLTKSGNLDWTKVITQVTKFHLNPDPESYAAASVLWDECCHRVSPLVFELCQQLQLVLEPSKCSKLKGDYRTGKRINMRKVIPYIASQFRKDKIWLRRSKPSKRSYQIILAVDDSQSMADNELKIMAFESLALLSKSLSLVEAGQMAVMSFGEETKLLHSLEDPFSDASGSRILTGFSFDQKKTRIDCLLNSASSIFLSSKSSAQSSNDISQLMIIISDGRGLFSEGEERVTQKIRQLNDAGVFCVFVILDTGKTSIFEHKTVSFLNGGVQTEYYMDHFPFPFYVVLKDVNNIPSILGESLRQWFELITQHK
jgi:midasin